MGYFKSLIQKLMAGSAAKTEAKKVTLKQNKALAAKANKAKKSGSGKKKWGSTGEHKAKSTADAYIANPQAIEKLMKVVKAGKPLTIHEIGQTLNVNRACSYKVAERLIERNYLEKISLLSNFVYKGITSA